jgi:hypothetical protein
LEALRRQREELEQKANDVAADAAASGIGRVNDLLGRLNNTLDGLTRSVERATVEDTSAVGSAAPPAGSN